MIYGLEPFDTLWPELTVLIDELWGEVDQRKEHTPLDVNVDTYIQLTNSGVYKPYTIRTDDRKLIGYIGIFVHPSLHCKDKDAVTDLMFVLPEYRGLGSNLLKLIEEDLREEGVNSFSFITKVKLDSGRLAEKLGFTLYEQTYQKRL